MSDIYKMAENMDRVNESQKSVADAFAELTRLLKNKVVDIKVHDNDLTRNSAKHYEEAKSD